VQRRRPSRLSYAPTLGLALATQVLCVSPLFAANSPRQRLQLQWSAPSECPTVEQVRNDVSTLLSNMPVNSDEPVTANATIQAKPDAGYSLSLTANGQTRVIEGASCQQLAQAAALLLALLVDSARASSLSDATTEQTRETHSELNDAKPVNQDAKNADAGQAALPRAETTTNKKPSTTSPESSKFLALAEIGARLDVGTWSKAQPALLVGVGFESHAWRLLGHASVGKSVHLTSRNGGGLDLSVATFDVMPAYKLTHGHWALESGMGAELGVTSVRRMQRVSAVHRCEQARVARRIRQQHG
jgi:hypothetical protein